MNIELPFTIEAAERFDSLYQLFSRKYQIEQNNLEISGRKLNILAVSNLDELLEELVAKNSNHIDIKDERLPYWAEIWPSAIGLAKFILENLVFTPEMKVLEIGCGVGLAGIAAKIKGANILLTDYQPDALRFCEMNWLLNLGFAPNTLLLDWRKPNLKREFQYILASDIVYEERYFQPVIELFQKLLHRAGHIFLSEPNRSVTKKFFKMLQEAGFNFDNFQLPVSLKKKKYHISVNDITIVRNRHT